MLLRDRFTHQGSFLFRWRSFLPLLLLLPALAALPDSGLLEQHFGEYVEEAWMGFCTILAFFGLSVRVATVGFVPAGTSGRNTAGQRAASLNTTGMYSVVCNPLYLGNMVTLVGFALAMKVWWLVLIAVPCVYLYYERVVYAEEIFLQATFGTAYEVWARQTPAFLPNFFLWRSPALSFSVRTAVRREYHGFYLIVVVMTLIEMASDVIGENEPLSQWLLLEDQWIIFLVLGSILYLAIRTIRKFTPWLSVPGR